MANLPTFGRSGLYVFGLLYFWNGFESSDGLVHRTSHGSSYDTLYLIYDNLCTKYPRYNFFLPSYDILQSNYDILLLTYDILSLKYLNQYFFTYVSYFVANL